MHQTVSLNTNVHRHRHYNEYGVLRWMHTPLAKLQIVYKQDAQNEANGCVVYVFKEASTVQRLNLRIIPLGSLWLASIQTTVHPFKSWPLSQVLNELLYK